MLYRCINAYYFRYLNSIGGIESHLYYVARKYGNYDITVFYKMGDETQINRLRQYIRCIQIDDYDKVICKKLFCCFNREILDHCEAEEKYLVLHGDYKAMIEKGQLASTNLPVDKRISKYIGVSQLVCDSWKEMTGIEAENVYEPIVLNDVEKPLMFISATRLTPEKGWDRMLLLADELDKHNVNYLWYIFTDSKKTPRKNMIFCEPRLDIADKIGGFDGFIQLSDNEGFCLSVVEALLRNVPVICTDLPVLREIGLDNTNSIKLPFDMSDIPIEKIRNIRKLKVNYKEPQDLWDKVLDLTPKTDKKIKVRASIGWQNRKLVDSELGRIPKPNEEWEISEERYEVIGKYEEKHRVRLIQVI